MQLALVLLSLSGAVAARPVSPAAPAAPAAKLAKLAKTAPADPRSSLRDELLQHPRCVQLVRSLVDGTGPRLAGSAGYARAVDWAVATMKALGLSNVHTEPVMVPRWERGQESGAVLAPIQLPLSLTALGHSVGTPPGGIEGELIEVPTLEALAALPREQVAGKIVLINKPTERFKSGEGYGKAGDIRKSGPAYAARQGAIGVLTRSLATGSDRFAHTGATKYEDDAPKLPAAALAVADVELLHRLLAAGQKVRVRYSLGAHLSGEVQDANVIGEVRGTGAPDEVVLLGAHLDSWDLATGAIDDGAGVGIVLDAARAIAAHGGARRTVRVVLFANEECGLDGGKAYARDHAAELPKHVAGLELDFGTGKAYGLTYLGGEGAGAVLGDLGPVLGPIGVGAPEVAKHHGADLTPLREAGVPMLALLQDGTTYFDWHHSANDTFERIEPEGLAQTAAATAVVVQTLADAPGRMAAVPEALRKDK